jgi:hypothetical protein
MGSSARELRYRGVVLARPIVFILHMFRLADVIKF